MIQINLLPPELRVSKKMGTLRLPLRQIGIAGAALAVLISVWFPAVNGLRASSLKRTQAELEALEPQRQKLAQVQESFQRLKRQTEAMGGMDTPQARWAPRLSLLSEAVAPQMWFTRFEYVQGKELRVSGSALVGSGGDGSGRVSQFLQHLKEQEGFAEWFRHVELQSVEHRYIQDEEVVDFVLLLTPTG